MWWMDGWTDGRTDGWIDGGLGEEATRVPSYASFISAVIVVISVTLSDHHACQLVVGSSILEHGSSNRPMNRIVI